ncbi:GGDEF domain-containing protein [Dyella acidisoli]|uniref:diguanylate cyclase n=1 Tax=Dyella acidisoli TaxID=1867834 RepID=A0ABQ5XRH8_9GAMM|nr:GGDEF domain-containing protein [Dyella acidisoli]GLQ93103.1 hypothetical protein GCM10007901_20540 [Dyella acidisoli]
MDSGSDKFSDKNALEDDQTLGRNVTDWLVYGLASRALMERITDEEIKRSIQFRLPLAAIVIGVDFFKEYIVQNGLSSGAKCLHAVISSAKSALRRKGDILSRYSNDEFVAIMPETHISGAIKVAKAMQASLDDMAIRHEASIYGKVTLSVGAAMLDPNMGATPIEGVRTTLLLEADRALCIAKLAGGNRVMVSILDPDMTHIRS